MDQQKGLRLKLLRINERFWDNRLWDLVHETRAITVIGVMVTGFLLGMILPIIEFDDGSVLHTREIFWAGALGFIIAMGIYVKKGGRYDW